MKKLIIILFLSFHFIAAQNFTGGFNFNLPYDDTTSQKFLPQFNAGPISADEFVSINSNGRFAVKDKQIRFWGTNLVAGGAFPDKNKADAIAGRLRKMGFNLVRFHHMDNPWSNESLFEYGSNTRHLNLPMLDKFEYIFAQLKKNGVYSNINLHVSRTFKADDGVESADSIPDFGKGVTLFDPHLIMLQKEFASQLLTHINPYTGLSLVDDPAMAMLEITNENSLYRMWRDGQLKPFSQGGKLLIRHSQMLDDLWHQFLSNKYSDSETLKNSWDEGISGSGGDNKIRDGGFENLDINLSWKLEQHNGASATMTRDLFNPVQGLLSAKVTVTNATGTAWHLQWKTVGLTLYKDSVYTLQFSARSDNNRTTGLVLMRDNEPYTYYNGKDFLLSTNWNTFTYSFRVNEDNIAQGRVSFQFTVPGIYWFDDISLTTAGVKGLLEGEDLTRKTVARLDYTDCPGYSDQRVKDQSEFYIKIQNDYYDEMYDYLKNTLKVKVPMNATNWNVGPADMAVQSRLDYNDNHAYWDHPSFPQAQWSAYDWYINNTPMVKSPDAGTIPHLFGGVAFLNKPYTISEYNHSFPNRYQSEALLFTTAYSSLHDADAIMFFDYNGGSGGWETDRVGSYFSINRNSVMMALTPSCAYAFRNFYLAKAVEEIKMSYSENTILLMPKNDTGGWYGPSLFPKNLALIHSIKTESFDSPVTTDVSSLPPAPVSPYESDTKQIIFSSGGLLKASSETFSGFTGFLNNFQNNTAGHLTLKSGNTFGTLTWISVNGDPLPFAKRSLITAASMIQNSNMIWDGTTTIHNEWGTAPTSVYPLVLSLELFIKADSIRIYPLDNTGKESMYNFRTIYPVSENKFIVEINQAANYTLWFGVEAYGEAINNISEEIIPSEYNLRQNYPNPFNSSTSIEYLLPREDNINLSIYDLLGRKVDTLINKKQPGGIYKVDWMPGNNINSGVYFLRFSTPYYACVKKIMLLK